MHTVTKRFVDRIENTATPLNSTEIREVNLANRQERRMNGASESKSSSQNNNRKHMVPVVDKLLGSTISMPHEATNDEQNLKPKRHSGASAETRVSKVPLQASSATDGRFQGSGSESKCNSPSKIVGKRSHLKSKDTDIVEQSQRQKDAKKSKVTNSVIVTTYSGCGGTVKSSRSGEDSFRERQILKNVREKERSFMIAKQITDLQQLLSYGGVQCATGTRRCILDESIKYIQELQKLLFDPKRPKARNGSESSCQEVDSVSPLHKVQKRESISHSITVNDSKNENAIDSTVYASAFRTTKIALAIATLGGNFVDCNSTFISLIGAKNKEEVCQMTIFNCIDEAHLHRSFELICSIVIQGATEEAFVVPSRLPIKKNLHTLNITLVHSDETSQAYFSVSLLEC